MSTLASMYAYMRECTSVHTCKAHINLKLNTNYTYRIEYQR